MTNTLMIFQLIVSVLLIIMVLVQFGKGAEAGFMASVDSSMTGAQQGNILNKITIVLAVLFLGNSVFLARMQGQQATSRFDDEAPIVRPLNSDEAMQEAEAAKEAAAMDGEAAKAETPKAEGMEKEIPKKEAKKEEAPNK